MLFSFTEHQRVSSCKGKGSGKDRFDLQPLLFAHSCFVIAGALTHHLTTPLPSLLAVHTAVLSCNRASAAAEGFTTTTVCSHTHVLLLNATRAHRVELQQSQQKQQQQQHQQKQSPSKKKAHIINNKKKSGAHRITEAYVLTDEQALHSLSTPPPQLPLIIALID